jgi:enoyl-[acyl-carrier protein] reductase II
MRFHISGGRTYSQSPVHDNWKSAIVDARETDTVFLNRGGKGPALRALRMARTFRIEEQVPESKGLMAR